MTSYKYKSIADCEICKDLSDHEFYDDPFDDLGNAPPEFKKKLAAIERLLEVRGQVYGSESIRKCLACGRLYFYAFFPIPNSDHSKLNVDRFSEEENELLKQLLELDNEDTLSKVLDKILCHESERMQGYAFYIFKNIIQHTSANKYTPAQVRLLTFLLSHSNPKAKPFACNLLAEIARHGYTIAIAVPSLINLLSDKKPGVRYDATEVLLEAAKHNTDLSAAVLPLVRILSSVKSEAYSKYPSDSRFSDPELNRELSQIVTSVLEEIARISIQNTKLVLDEIKKAKINEEIPEVKKSSRKMQRNSEKVVRMKNKINEYAKRLKEILEGRMIRNESHGLTEDPYEKVDTKDVDISSMVKQIIKLINAENEERSFTAAEILVMFGRRSKQNAQLFLDEVNRAKIDRNLFGVDYLIDEFKAVTKNTTGDSKK